MSNHLGCEGTWSHITHAENAKLEMFCEDQIKPLEKRQGVTTWDWAPEWRETMGQKRQDTKQHPRETTGRFEEEVGRKHFLPKASQGGAVWEV